jgi:F-type H+-transporting ATPase subunit epsilon
VPWTVLFNVIEIFISMNLVVLTPGTELYRGEIKAIIVPGKLGQFEVLRHHAPIVSALKSGDVHIEDINGKKTSFKIEKGFIEVLFDNISVLVQGVED